MKCLELFVDNLQGGGDQAEFKERISVIKDLETQELSSVHNYILIQAMLHPITIILKVVNSMFDQESL